MNQLTTMLVLRKTKLGETDLIITGFSEEGVQIRAVAKGARKPGSRLGVHLELFSIARVLIAQGRNLGIITEVSTVISNEACRCDIKHSAGASVIVELLDRISSDGDREIRLFPLVCEALRCLGEVPEEGVSLIAAAAALKIAAQLGFRPSLHTCVFCGSTIHQNPDREMDQTSISFSFDQGGVICDNCLTEYLEQDYTAIDTSIIKWVDVLITSRFADLEQYANLEYESLGHILLDFTNQWTCYHLVRHLKSLDFLLSFG